jgi:hypothetical protein
MCIVSIYILPIYIFTYILSHLPSSFPSLSLSFPLSLYTRYSLFPYALLTLLPYKALTRTALAGTHFRVQVLGFRLQGLGSSVQG